MITNCYLQIPYDKLRCLDFENNGASQVNLREHPDTCRWCGIVVGL